MLCSLEGRTRTSRLANILLILFSSAVSVVVLELARPLEELDGAVSGVLLRARLEAAGLLRVFLVHMRREGGTSEAFIDVSPICPSMEACRCAGGGFEDHLCVQTWTQTNR